MNEVDARGLSCPEPVLLTAQALKSGSGVPLRVLVSEAYARQNVEKYAKSQGRQVSVTPKRFRAGLYPCPGNFRQAAAWPGARLKVKKGGWESC